MKTGRDGRCPAPKAGAISATGHVALSTWASGSIYRPAPHPQLAVVDGLLTVELDFGAGVFNGEARWLEIAVACPSGGVLQPLSPRQPLTAAPCTRG